VELIQCHGYGAVRLVIVWQVVGK